MTDNVDTLHNRVAVFHSVETQHEAAPGQWVRVKSESTPPISAIINKFLKDNEANVLFVSTPSLELVSSSKSKAKRVYRCSVSIIYQGKEVIHDATVNAAHPVAAHHLSDGGGPIEEERDPVFSDPGITEEQRKTIANGIRESNRNNVVPGANKLSNDTRVVSANFAPKAKVHTTNNGANKLPSNTARIRRPI